MQYIINEKMLCIPPYISTGWDNIVTIHLEQDSLPPTLVVSLKNATSIRIPALESEVMNKVFQAHTGFLEGQSKKEKSVSSNAGASPFNMDNIIGLGLPIKMGGALEGLGAAMQHNPQQANSPNLPQEVLEKIAAIAKIMDTDPNLSMGLKAEPHCNCTHCQIARAICGEPPKEENKPVEEEVTEEDLKFKSWDISQTGDKLYSVKNPLDEKEQYNVFLGQPLGCTCGQKNCEHIKAVLNT